MFSKIIITMLMLAISVASFGAEETAKTKEVINYIKEKFEIAYHGEYYFVHDATNKIKDFNHMQMPILTYKFAKNWKFTGLAEFKYTDNNAANYPNRFFRSLYTVTRENLLTEKDHGVKMDLGLGRRMYDRKTVPNTFGNTRIFANFSRAIPGGIGKNSASLVAQYLLNDAKNVTASTWKHGIELIPAVNLQLTEKLSYSLQDDINFNSSDLDTNPRKSSLTHEAYSTFTYKYNDKISPYFQLKYVHGDQFNPPKDPGTPYENDTISYYVGAGCAVTSKITLTPEIGTDIFASSDRKTIADKFKYIDLALYVDITF